MGRVRSRGWTLAVVAAALFMSSAPSCQPELPPITGFFVAPRQGSIHAQWNAIPWANEIVVDVVGIGTFPLPGTATSIDVTLPLGGGRSGAAPRNSEQYEVTINATGGAGEMDSDSGIAYAYDFNSDGTTDEADLAFLECVVGPPTFGARWEDGDANLDFVRGPRQDIPPVLEEATTLGPVGYSCRPRAVNFAVSGRPNYLQFFLCAYRSVTHDPGGLFGLYRESDPMVHIEIDGNPISAAGAEYTLGDTYFCNFYELLMTPGTYTVDVWAENPMGASDRSPRVLTFT